MKSRVLTLVLAGIALIAVAIPCVGASLVLSRIRRDEARCADRRHYECQMAESSCLFLH